MNNERTYKNYTQTLSKSFFKNTHVNIEIQRYFYKFVNVQYSKNLNFTSNFIMLTLIFLEIVLLYCKLN